MLQPETSADGDHTTAWRSSAAKLLIPKTGSLEKNAHIHMKEHTFEKKLPCKMMKSESFLRGDGIYSIHNSL